MSEGVATNSKTRSWPIDAAFDRIQRVHATTQRQESAAIVMSSLLMAWQAPQLQRAPRYYWAWIVHARFAAVSTKSRLGPGVEKFCGLAPGYKAGRLRILRWMLSWHSVARRRGCMGTGSGDSSLLNPRPILASSYHLNPCTTPKMYVIPKTQSCTPHPKASILKLEAIWIQVRRLLLPSPFSYPRALSLPAYKPLI